MLNYEKWKKLNENFMMSNPLGITSRNGFLAYNPLNEKAEEEEVEVEEESEDEDEDEDKEDHEEEDHEEEEHEEEHDEDMDDEDMDDEDMDDEDMDDEDMDDEDMDDEDMDDEDMQDETGEVEVVEDEESDDEGHGEDKMVVAKKCGYCGSYMKAENTTPEFQEWLESVRSIINPHVNAKLNGDILNEGAISPQLKKYVMAKKKGKKIAKSEKKAENEGCGCCDKCKCGETKMKVMDKKSPKMSKKKSLKMSEKKSAKMSWKKSPKK